MKYYPESTLQDLYKSFFQDRFGAGHLIVSRENADSCLRAELEASEEFSGISYEQTGCEGNFYRVNLSVIKTGQVPYDLFLDAFMCSATANLLDENWETEWLYIDSVIAAMNLHLVRYETERPKLLKLAQSDCKAVHHSREYRDSYNPHYRIIEKKIFEREILPLIIKN